MYLKKFKANEFKFLLGISFICFVYGYLITLNSLVLNNTFSIIFIILLIFSLYLGSKICEKLEDRKSTIVFLLLITFVVNFFMIIGTAAAFPAEKMLWVTDSYDMHIPGSVRIMEFFQGKMDSPIIRSSIYDRTYLAHILGAIFFALFGVNQIASSLSLLTPKVICAYFIFKGTKSLLGFDYAKVATLTYAFLPTAIFYTITFYKEATLQMLISMILYFIIMLYNRPRFRYFIALIFLFLFLGNERHYLVPCFAVAAILFVFLSKRLNLTYKIGTIAVCIIGYKLFTAYYWDVNFSRFLETLIIFKNKYSDYPDVTTINKNLPYPLGVFKLMLSPYVTIIKLETYTHYATLLTWGSITYHILALFFMVSCYKICKVLNKSRLIIILMAPFVIFLFTFGYVAPYNGRLRDSFLPLIIMIGSYSINAVIKKSKEH